MGEREGGGGGSAPEKKNRRMWRGRRRKKVLATGLIVLGRGEGKLAGKSKIVH